MNLDLFRPGPITTLHAPDDDEMNRIANGHGRQFVVNKARVQTQRELAHYDLPPQRKTLAAGRLTKAGRALFRVDVRAWARLAETTMYTVCYVLLQFQMKVLKCKRIMLYYMHITYNVPIEYKYIRDSDKKIYIGLLVVVFKQ